MQGPHILDEIIAHKRAILPVRKGLVPTAVLEKYPYFERRCSSLAASLRMGAHTGIIAEFKRSSPSKGVINDAVTVAEVAAAYAAGGAAAISVLTDDRFFGGSNDDLMDARDTVDLPLLRKDFIIDEYQILEAKAIGADLILLIAACLTPAEVKALAAFAQGIGMEVLLELHEAEELGHICEGIELVGINNRNLKTFEVDIERSLRMAGQIPAGKIKIAESGIHTPAQVNVFREHGFSGFLMGEQFMKHADPGDAFRQFVAAL